MSASQKAHTYKQFWETVERFLFSGEIPDLRVYFRGTSQEHMHKIVLLVADFNSGYANRYGDLYRILLCAAVVYVEEHSAYNGPPDASDILRLQAILAQYSCDVDKHISGYVVSQYGDNPSVDPYSRLSAEELMTAHVHRYASRFRTGVRGKEEAARDLLKIGHLCSIVWDRLNNAVKHQAPKTSVILATYSENYPECDYTKATRMLGGADVRQNCVGNRCPFFAEAPHSHENTQRFFGICSLTHTLKEIPSHV